MYSIYNCSLLLYILLLTTFLSCTYLQCNPLYISSEVSLTKSSEILFQVRVYRIAALVSQTKKKLLGLHLVTLLPCTVYLELPLASPRWLLFQGCWCSPPFEDFVWQKRIGLSITVCNKLRFLRFHPFLVALLYIINNHSPCLHAASNHYKGYWPVG